MEKPVLQRRVNFWPETKFGLTLFTLKKRRSKAFLKSLSWVLKPSLKILKPKLPLIFIIYQLNKLKKNI